jgi:hypothetical protein
MSNFVCEYHKSSLFIEVIKSFTTFLLKNNMYPENQAKKLVSTHKLFIAIFLLKCSMQVVGIVNFNTWSTFIGCHRACILMSCWLKKVRNMRIFQVSKICEFKILQRSIHRMAQILLLSPENCLFSLFPIKSHTCFPFQLTHQRYTFEATENVLPITEFHELYDVCIPIRV